MRQDARNELLHSSCHVCHTVRSLYVRFTDSCMRLLQFYVLCWCMVSLLANALVRTSVSIDLHAHIGVIFKSIRLRAQAPQDAPAANSVLMSSKLSYIQDRRSARANSCEPTVSVQREDAVLPDFHQRRSSPSKPAGASNRLNIYFMSSSALSHCAA